MAFQFTKSQRTAFDTRLKALQTSEAEMQNAVSAFNAVVAEEFSKMQAAFEQFEEDRGAMHDLLVEVEEENRNAFDERSDTWQESERGEAVSAWLDSLAEGVQSVESMEQELSEPEEVTAYADGLDELGDIPMVPEA